VSESDVLVVGGGPAGSATAALLAREGWSVTVLERAVLPRPKACGECLNPGAVGALRRIGMLEAVLALSPAVIRGWELRSGARRAAGSFSSDGVFGLGVARGPLDAALLGEARRAGARVEEGVTVRTVGEAEAHGRILRTRERDGAIGARTARVIVGADGLRSVTARAIGALKRAPRLRKLSLTARVRGRMATSGRGMMSISDDATVGIAPVDARETLWNLTVVVDAARSGRAVAGAPLAFLLERAARSEWSWQEGPEVVEGPWASGPFDWPTRAVSADALVLVGDAAGYYDPLTGQGIHQALHSAELAAETIDSALRRGRVSGADLRRYARRSLAAFAPGRAVQRVIEHVVSRAALRMKVLPRLAARPSAFDALLAVTGDRAPVHSLMSPRVLSSLLLPEREKPTR
jgi:flavin-dependent dehydrogenase